MITPLDPIVAELVSQLNPNHREAFEERAGIVEFDAGKSRAHAECLALLDLISRHPAALSGLAVLEVAHEGKTRWLLTHNLAQARAYLAHTGGREVSYRDPTDVLTGQLNGLALLTPLREPRPLRENQHLI